MLKTLLKVLLVLVVLIAVAAAGGYMWANAAADAKLTKTWSTHTVDYPTPFPLTEAEIEAFKAEKLAGMSPADPAQPPPDPLAGVDLAAIAKERAIARAEHLINSRYACTECHGANLGGGTMIDDPAIGTIKGPNLTTGKGGKGATFTAADWDRAVRHGVKSDGTGSIMPSNDYFGMTDRELSDVVTYILAQPPVDNQVVPLVPGPLGTVLIATGQLTLAAEGLADHQKAHVVEPPEVSDQLAFGKHMAQVCTGCHGPELVGGPVAGGDPSWPPASNLTPHADGLAGWTFEDFQRALVEAKSRNGTPLREPMAAMPKYAKNMKPEELQALWAWLQSIPAKPGGA